MSKIEEKQIQEWANDSAGGLTNDGTSYERLEHIEGFKSGYQKATKAQKQPVMSFLPVLLENIEAVKKDIENIKNKSEVEFYVYVAIEETLQDLVAIYEGNYINQFREAQKWVDVNENMEALPKGFYAIRIQKNNIVDVKTEYIRNGSIDYFNATHYYRITLPEAP